MGDIRCGNCGASVSAKAPYCPKCGASSDFFGRKEMPVQAESVRSESTSQPAVREVYKEKEIIREVVKIRCRHCGTLFEEKETRCPHCGAPP